jgi:hypothetical protein
MNKRDHKALGIIASRLDELVGEFEGLTAELEALKDAEREKFDNMPEGLQQGDRGQSIEAAADALESAYGNLEEINSQLGDCVSTLAGIE